MSSLNWLWVGSYGALPAPGWSSLRFAADELLTPLALARLEDCPVLEESRITVEGDCRQQQRPAACTVGLSSLVCHLQLCRMTMDCGGVVGYALTAPSGYMDLSLWERFYLNGIGNVNLIELNYWPPQDRNANQRTPSPCSRIDSWVHEPEEAFHSWDS